MSHLQWHVESAHDATIVRVVGEVDLSTRADFADAMAEAMTTTAPLIVIDLTEVTFIGSTGLQLLIEAHDNARQTRRQLRVAHGDGIASRAFKVAGIDQLLATYQTPEDALRN